MSTTTRTPAPWKPRTRRIALVALLVLVVYSVVALVWQERRENEAEREQELTYATHRLALDLFEADAGEHDTWSLEDKAWRALDEHQTQRTEEPAHPDPDDLADHLREHHPALALAYATWFDENVGAGPTTPPADIWPGDSLAGPRWDLLVTSFAAQLDDDSDLLEEIDAALDAAHDHVVATEEDELPR